MAAESPTPFALRLTLARKAAHLTQSAAAGFVGVSRPTYQRWESGELEPSVSQLVALAAMYGTTPGDLLDGTPVNPEHGIIGRVVALEEAMADLRRQD